MKKRTAHLGGKWNNGTNAGPFYWNFNNSASNRNRNIGTRLAYAGTESSDTQGKPWYPYTYTVEASPLGGTASRPTGFGTGLVGILARKPGYPHTTRTAS